METYLSLLFGYKSFTIIVSLVYQKQVLQCLSHSINSITVLQKLLFLSCTCLVNSDSKAIWPRLGKKPSTTYQSSCQHLSAVVDWQICSCFTLQIWPNQLCGGGKTNSFLTSWVLSHSLFLLLLPIQYYVAFFRPSYNLVKNWQLAIWIVFSTIMGCFFIFI